MLLNNKKISLAILELCTGTIFSTFSTDANSGRCCRTKSIRLIENPLERATLSTVLLPTSLCNFSL